MTPTEYRDRLQRLERRSDFLFNSLQNNPLAHLQLMQVMWQAARAGVASDQRDFVSLSKESDEAAGHTSLLDSLLGLLERIARPSVWIDEQAPWFHRARQCLLDAAAHAAMVHEEQKLLPPILAVEPIDSPLYYSRVVSSASWARPATPADLPLPIIVCPGNILEEPWEWASLFHELGHHLDASREEKKQLVSQLIVLEEERNIDLGLWTTWIGESLADVYAGLLGGAAAVASLAEIFARNRYGSAGHPPGEARAEVLVRTWNSLREGTPIQDTEPNLIVAKLLADHFRPWQSSIRKDDELSSSYHAPPRLVPGLLWRHRQSGAEPSALRDLCTNLLARSTTPEWVPTEARLATLRSAMSHLVETRVIPGSALLKIPPIELLVRHESISFVGATHGQLLGQLKDAMRERGKPWRRIELFALADPSLIQLTLSEQSGAKLIEERDRSLKDLKDYLLEQNVPHRLFLYNQLYLFASYWDAEENEARPPGPPPAHIHVSSALWDTDLRQSPAQDYEAPAGQPLPSPMRQYVDALKRLRAISTEI